MGLLYSSLVDLDHWAGPCEDIKAHISSLSMSCALSKEFSKNNTATLWTELILLVFLFWNLLRTCRGSELWLWPPVLPPETHGQGISRTKAHLYWVLLYPQFLKNPNQRLLNIRILFKGMKDITNFEVLVSHKCCINIFQKNLKEWSFSFTFHTLGEAPLYWKTDSLFPCWWWEKGVLCWRNCNKNYDLICGLEIV
jgi:hypothetical protein